MIESQGWIKLHRTILEWEWYKDINTKILFLHLLLKANHRDKKFQGNTVKRGQLVTGLFVLSDETSLTVQQLRTSLKKLKSTNEITIESSSKNSLITIINYDNYQVKDDDQQAEQQTNNKPSTNEQQTNNKRATTNKNVKNNKKERSKEDIYSLLGAEAQKKSVDSLVIQDSLNHQKEKEKNSAQKEKEFGKSEFRETLIQLGANPKHVDDWLKVRTTKKAVFTETAIKKFINECNNNNFQISEAVRICAENSWQGFQYSWVQNLYRNGTGNTTQSRQARADSVDELGRAADAILQHASQNN